MDLKWNCDACGNINLSTVYACVKCDAQRRVATAELPAAERDYHHAPLESSSVDSASIAELGSAAAIKHNTIAGDGGGDTLSNVSVATEISGRSARRARSRQGTLTGGSGGSGNRRGARSRTGSSTVGYRKGSFLMREIKK